MPHVYEKNDLRFFVGKNARENWQLLDNAEDHDLWIHLHQHTSCYVIIENTDLIEDEDIIYGCELCKKHSKLKDKNRVKCDVLAVEHVKKGKRAGEAILLENPKIISV